MSGDRLAEHERFMQRALELGSRGLGLTSPNPPVGAVVVREGAIVGEGWHARAGTPHAEVGALAQAGDRARGATLYVTLEPCCHHGRTPPCAEAVVRAGVARVVYAVGDPDPRVAGGGHALLEQQGIEVLAGIMTEQALELARHFLVSTRQARPYVTLKWAMSLDGRSATRTGHSHWVTGPAARAWVHEQRALHDAVLAGIGTVLADNPRLDARLGTSAAQGPKPLAVQQDTGSGPPWELPWLEAQVWPDERLALARRGRLRVVLDGMARTPPNSHVLDPSLGPTLIGVRAEAPVERVEALRSQGGEVLVLEGLDDASRLACLLEGLARRGIRSVFVEGGSQVHASFLAAGLFDDLLTFVAPWVVGGEQALSAVTWTPETRVRMAWPSGAGWCHLPPRRVGEDWLFESRRAPEGS